MSRVFTYINRNFLKTNLVKTSLILIASALFAPATILVGASTLAIVGFTTLAGVGAIALNDYAKPISNSSKFSTASVAKKIESLPLAA
jgi:hypothetical protein